MNLESLKVGHRATLEVRATPDLAITLGDASADAVTVFSTPSMINLMEHAARKALSGFLGPGKESVGIRVDVRHLAAIPVPALVRAEAVVTAVEGKVIEFEVSAWDEHRLIGEGHHSRAIIDLRRFRSSVEADPMRTQDEKKELPMTDHTHLPQILEQPTTLRIDRNGRRLDVRLNRPSKRNAINAEMTDELEALVDWLAGVPVSDITVVVLEGSGDVFCAGEDIVENHKLSLEEQSPLARRRGRLMERIESLPSLWIAAINGPALGGGMALAAACDFRLASHNAHFGMPEVSLGWCPPYSISRITSLVGPTLARELLLAGKLMDARAAQESGFLNGLHPSNRIEAETEELVRKLLQLPAAALAHCKAAIHQAIPPFRTGEEFEGYLRTRNSADALEGMAAFFEKRKARFGGE